MSGKYWRGCCDNEYNSSVIKSDVILMRDQDDQVTFDEECFWEPQRSHTSEKEVILIWKKANSSTLLCTAITSGAAASRLSSFRCSICRTDR